MKTVMTGIFLILSIICVDAFSMSAPPLPDTLDNTPAVQPLLSYDALSHEIAQLNTTIGSYPPLFKNEEHKQATYQKWLNLMAEVNAHQPNLTDSEVGMYLRAELYRQGNNMGVDAARTKTIAQLTNCFSVYPDSTRCHFSSMYFNLSGRMDDLASAEKSLLRLRENFHPEVNSEVEAGFIYLYLYKTELTKAKKEIEMYLQRFPDNHRYSSFLQLRMSLGESANLVNY